LCAYQELLEATRKNAVTPDLLKRVEETIAASDLQYLFDQIPAAIKETLEGVDRVTKIVRAMKEFSHPGSKERTSSDLNKAIESTTTVARNEWKYVADVELALDASVPAIEAIPSAMNQVVLNLVVNAAHAIEEKRSADGPKGKITISTRRDGEFVELTVADTGCGIPADSVARIFDPFFTTKKVGKGTGQGLAIVRRVVIDRHGGAIDVQSKVGEGTSFHVRLPIEGKVGTLERLTA
jgi:signal transduction histidine kinase